ncbi:regulator of chromosome condensation 1/beta-lactamase-inhibitor protein II [Bombardia bombarda]|uniref:Regulator of chromosome condensation 1/beta-lactamase-inhibitor protein II n=1 Tax=Bombardia bombarda TaxID=252184 RepID=A0AA40CF11_9PEZI|nr:regulator of chromosome condensation 1/beta-lactamase-inhibitor protein II [Bombardia bombarda]
MELYATGFNAWNQLRFEDGGNGLHLHQEPDDIRVFTRVLSDDAIDHVDPFISYTLVRSRPAGGLSFRLRSAGMVPKEHDALRAAADDDDDIYKSQSAKLGHVNFAEASNGFVIVYGRLDTFHQYQSMRDLLSHKYNNNLKETPGTDTTTTQHTFSGFPNVVQLVAYETGFAALSSTGQVWTWGDERYAACLGRDVDDDTSPPNKPGLVTDLEDLPTGPITKIAAGGYTLAALTAGNDLYCWGDRGRSAVILDDMGDRPTPIVIDDNDIADIGVGDQHLIALTVDGELFTIGNNSNGQLGLQASSAASWTRVDLGLDTARQSIVGVAAGSRNSFVIVRNQG